MKSLFKQNGGIYRTQSDYLIPNLTLSKSEENDISVYGELHLCYLQEHRRLTYINLLTSGTLNKYLSEIDKQARERFCRIVKQFTEQVPDSLIEAAYIDGASDVTVYRKIVIPLIKPAIATATILVFQQVWTNVETSNYYINDDSMKTLTFYMNSMINVNNTVAGQGMSAAATLILFIPNLVLFIILQNGVMNTMAHSGIK